MKGHSRGFCLTKEQSNRLTELLRRRDELEIDLRRASDEELAHQVNEIAALRGCDAHDVWREFGVPPMA